MQTVHLFEVMFHLFMFLFDKRCERASQYNGLLLLRKSCHVLLHFYCYKL